MNLNSDAAIALRPFKATLSILNMYECKLLEVQDHFQLTGIGLTVHPDFSVPQSGKWNDYESKAKVITPEGKETVIKVHIGTWHFNIRDHKILINVGE